MQFFCKRTEPISLAVAIGRLVAVATLTLSLAGCTESKLVQCTKIMESVNKGNGLVAAQKDHYDAATTQHLAQYLTDTAKEIEALQLTDKPLQSFQSQLVKSFRNLSQALTEVGRALQTGNQIETSLNGREQLNKAKAQLATAGQTANQLADRQDALTDQLVSYCNSKE